LRRVLVVLTLFALLFAVSGCGNKTKVVSETNKQGQVTTRTVPSVHFAKTKFILHGALAYGAFHRYIYKPFRAGKFKKGASGQKVALAKAGAATLFVVRELKQMKRAALSDDQLRPIAEKVDGAIPHLDGLSGVLKTGGAITGAGGLGGIAGAATGLDDIIGAAKGLGVNIPLDKAPAL